MKPTSTREEHVGGRPPRFYTVREVAALMRMSPVTIYRAISDDEFPVVRVRGKLSIPARAIDAMEEAAVERGGLVDAADFVQGSGPTPLSEFLQPHERSKGRPRPGANQTGAGSFSTQQRAGYGEDATPVEGTARAGGAR